MICSLLLKPYFAAAPNVEQKKIGVLENFFEAICNFPHLQIESLRGRILAIPNLRLRIKESLAGSFVQKQNLIIEAGLAKLFDQVQQELSSLATTLSLQEKDQLLTHAVEIALKTDTNDLYQRVATLFTAEDCENLSKLKNNNIPSLIELAERLAQLTSTIKDFPDSQIPSISETPIIDFLLKLLNIIRITFSLIEIGKEPDSYFEGAYMLDIFCKLILIPLAIFSFLNVFLPTLAAAGIVATTILVTYIVINFLPQPIHLPDFCINLSQLAQEGKIKPISGRDELTRKLTNGILSRAHSKPILTGESGVGKTSIAINLACTLKDKVVILVPTAALIPPEGSDFKLKKPRVKLMEAIRNREDVIVFFDEIQGALMKEGLLAEEFKNEMPAVYFGASTSKDYEEKIKKEEGLRTRFGYRLEVTDLSKEDTCEILKEYAEKEAPEFEFKNDVFETVYKLAEKGPNPFASRDLLARLIVEIRDKHRFMEQSPSFEDKEKKELPPERISLQYLVSAEAIVVQENMKLRNRVQQEEHQKQNDREAQLEEFKKLKKLRNHLEKQTRLLARGLTSEIKPKLEEIQQFLSNLLYVQPFVEGKINEIIKDNRLQNIFDSRMVEPYLKQFA